MRVPSLSDFLHTRIPLYVASALLAASSLSGCAGSSRGGVVPYDPPNFAPPVSNAASVVSPGSEMLQRGDVIRVTVFQEPDMSGEFRLDTNGRIDLPLLGQIQAQGQTPAQLATTIQSGLASTALRDPKVTVALKEAAERTITVDGAVTQPGVFKINDPVTLIQAVALARGTTQDANESQVLVFRNVNGQRMAAAFDLRDIRRAKANDPTIYPTDTVVVLDSKSRALYRDILQSIPILAIFRPF